jgi:alpha-beta hydrolase superfamily lysophospholipase
MFGDIKNAQGERLDYSFHDGGTDNKQIVVIGHGVTGNKDRPFVIALAEGLAKAGLHALRFSFAGNGDSEGKFTDCTISKEVSDLGSVMDSLQEYSLCYAGHSMGGAVGVLRTSQDQRIQHLISLAGMVHTQEFAHREFGMVTPDAGNMWNDDECPLSQIYMDDMKSIDSVVKLGSQITVPWLLVHGSEDDVVPIQDSKDILEQAGSNAQFIELPGANHVFAEEHCAKMVEAVVPWVTRQWSK